ncbi:MAG: acetylglucosamine-6-sulfatase [Thermoguttaceae bacterium]|nr:acetylglucosamine-6-sulfatase [Thermoguttaceae bacterium]
MRVLSSIRMFSLTAAVCLAAVWLSSHAVSAQEASLPASVVPAERLGDQWWKNRHEANRARVAEGDVDLLLLGDSITHNWDGVGREVEAYYYGDRKCVNMGFGGDRTQHLLWRLGDLPADKIHPKAAMVLIGVNNTLADPPADIALGIKANVDKLRELWPDMNILLLNIFPDYEKDHPERKEINAANALLPEMFKDYPNLTLLDISEIWLDENGDVPKDLMSDGVHPTEYGYKLWGAAVEPVIARMLGEEAKPAME